MAKTLDPLRGFQKPVRAWFLGALGEPTLAQAMTWPKLHAGGSTLVFAPTGSGKTLAAFLVAIDRLMFSPEPEKKSRCRVLYVSPIKALAVDVERNLRSPLIGIAQQAALLGMPYRALSIGIRSGDTPAAERARISRTPPDILVTTPESLYLLLTSQAAEVLRSVDTLILDEVHALSASKRGAHLMASVERLEHLRGAGPALQRIGLSATQKPLTEIARFVGGVTFEGEHAIATPRPVTIVEVKAHRPLSLALEVAIADMTALDALPRMQAASFSGKKDPGSPVVNSIWSSIVPRLVELVRTHRTTMVFTNSRRLAERLASAINAYAEAPLARAHHGSLAREEREIVEDALKAGTLPCIVATASLELGLDLGAVDLVVQIESPPSVASGLQRVGRSNHHVGGTPKGIFFPKHRGDLVASAAVLRTMGAFEVEATRYPRNPLDVLAQQMVAMVASGEFTVHALFSCLRCAAPFETLTMEMFTGVLDMLSGRYPSTEFAELKPRIIWNRSTGELSPRKGARMLAAVNGGTIPDRGMYPVFLGDGAAADASGASGKPQKGGRRVGELDEEMVFETREGEVILLGASSWRVTHISHQKVLVIPAPGEPGKMPFWHGDRAGRAPETGALIGRFTRDIAHQKANKADAELADLGLNPEARENLLRYLREQLQATGEVPSDRTLIFERFQDEFGDLRICILSPFGLKVHAPLSLAIQARLLARGNMEVEAMYFDDGIVFRFPEAERFPDPEELLPSADELEDLIVGAVGQSSLFAARFREAAGRSLLLPKRHPQTRAPLWSTRKKAADLLRVAVRYPSFPVLLETYREILRDVYDVPGARQLLEKIEQGSVRLLVRDSRLPSPFAASLLFAYVANFMYEGDAPLSERRAFALTVDYTQLKELLGSEAMRQLLDGDVVAALEQRLQRFGSEPRDGHELADLLRSVGDLSEVELRARLTERSLPSFSELIQQAELERAIIHIRIAGEVRLAAAEDAALYRDALGTVLPQGIADALLQARPHATFELLQRYGRTHGPFTAETIAARYGLGAAVVRTGLTELVGRGKLLQGAFLPQGTTEEYCDAEVLRQLRGKTLARLRDEIEPVQPADFVAFLLVHHGIGRKERGRLALVAAIGQLEGASIIASTLETEVLPARVAGYQVGDIDALIMSGELAWVGLEPLGERDGRISLHFTSIPAWRGQEPAFTREGCVAILQVLRDGGALFFRDIAARVGGFLPDLIDALWELVWLGQITNDSFVPLRARMGRHSQPGRSPSRHRARTGAQHGSRDGFSQGSSGRSTAGLGRGGMEGRWSVVSRAVKPANAQAEAAAQMEMAEQLLRRHGILTREVLAKERIADGLSGLYKVLREMEAAGRVRRGYFIAAQGAMQYALPGVESRLRERNADLQEKPQWLAATDPASPFGAGLPWPERTTASEQGAMSTTHSGYAVGTGPQRAAGAKIVVYRGKLLGFLSKNAASLLTYLAVEEPQRSQEQVVLAAALRALAEAAGGRSFNLKMVDGVAALQGARFLLAHGFEEHPQGLRYRPQREGAESPRRTWGVERAPTVQKPMRAADAEDEPRLLGIGDTDDDIIFGDFSDTDMDGDDAV